MGILDELVGKLGDMDQPVLMDADIDEGAEGRDVGHDAFQHHAEFEVLQFVDTFLEHRRLELGTRIAARLLQLGDDVLDGRQAELVIGEVFRAQRAQQRRVADDFLQRLAGLGNDALHHRI